MSHPYILWSYMCCFHPPLVNFNIGQDTSQSFSTPSWSPMWFGMFHKRHFYGFVDCTSIAWNEWHVYTDSTTCQQFRGTWVRFVNVARNTEKERNVNGYVHQNWRKRYAMLKQALGIQRLVVGSSQLAAAPVPTRCGPYKIMCCLIS